MVVAVMMLTMTTTMRMRKKILALSSRWDYSDVVDGDGDNNNSGDDDNIVDGDDDNNDDDDSDYTTTDGLGRAQLHLQKVVKLCRP